MRLASIDVAGWWLAITLVAAYALLQTVGVGELMLVVWTALAALLALASPLAGVTVLAAIGLFTEAQTEAGRITAVPFLLSALGTGLLIRLAATRPLPRPALPVLLAIVLLAGTALGVLHTALDFGPDAGLEAARAWVPGIGGGLTVFLAAAWISWRGDVRPLYVALASIGLAALVSVIDFAADGVLLGSPFGWLLRDHNPDRLTEIIPAPNAAAAIFLVGAALGAAAAVFGRRPGVRLLGMAAALPCLGALFLTYSRSGWLAAGLALAVLAWHWRRRVGLVAIGSVLALILAVVAFGLVREVPLEADQARLDSWAAAARMSLADPLFGHGFRSFEWLHATYGSPTLDAPHNEWLRLFAEEGALIGLAGAAFALRTPLLVVRAPGWLAAGAAAAGAAFFMMAFFNNPFIYTQVNVPAFLVVGIGVGVAQRHVPSANPASADG